MPRTARLAATAAAKEVLGDTVFQGMEGDYG
jgi:hypothetical protein